MDLIYYYTPEIALAPSAVAKNILENLLKRENEWPFDNLKLVVKSRSVERTRQQFGNLEVITRRDIFNAPKNCLIHIPTSPIILPNTKFLLHLFAILKNRKLILQYHGDIRIEMRQRLRYEHFINVLSIPSYVLLPPLLKSANGLIVNSYFMSNLVKDKYGVKNDIVIPNAIDDFWFDENNRESIPLEGDPAIFYHGKLVHLKGVDLLIRGFSRVLNDNPKARLYLAGGGAERGDFEKLCKKLGIEKKVEFLGFLEKHELKRYLGSVDVAIYPSTYEPFSLAILEAFSSANGPVYFSQLAGIDDFVMRDGYSFNSFEPTVNNICKIIGDIKSKAYDNNLIKKQKEFARQYTWDKVITQYIEVYKDMA